MKQDCYKLVTDYLRGYRRRHKLTQADMARKTGLLLASYRRIETGSTKISVETLARIAQITEADLHQLITGDIAPAVRRKLCTLGRYIARELNQLYELNSRYMTELTEIKKNRAMNLPYDQERKAYLQEAILETAKRIDEAGKDLAELYDLNAQ